MDMFNRIKSTVSSFSTVLPGNQVTREYEVIEPIGSCGPSLLWKVYKAMKKSTKEEAAVFLLEKKLLEKYPKHERDCILEIMKKGVANLTRLRHPSILTVQYPLEESRESLAFATEPVFASLANVLGNHENLPIPPPKFLKDYELFDVEIKYGLLQVVEGLAFLHNDVKMLHRNVNPESIMLNKHGAWKLAGFDFCVQSISTPGTPEHFSFPDIEVDRPPPCFPHFDYLAPEYILTMSCSTSSDMYSYGSLIYAVYNKGKAIINNCGALSSMKQNFNKLKQLPLSTFNCLPSDFREHVRMLLNVTPEIRPDAFQTSKLKMFEDVGVKTLQYLDSLYQWDNLQKSHFYKGLPQILSNLPKRVTLFRILPCLVKEYCIPEMVPFVLPNVLLIAEEATKEEFLAYIVQDMVPLFRLQEPVQIMLIFMQKMELLLKKCTPPIINNHVLPMIYRALEADAQQIQELCLSIIPGFASLIEYPAMKNALIPRIKKLCISTNFLSVRVNCLVCLGKLLEHLDKWLVLDEILPFLPQIPCKEPAVLMGILGILKLTMSHKKLGITKEVMATKTIPFLMPLSIENGLTLNQFNAIMSVVKEMVCRVEADHKTKLEQLNSIRQDQNTTLGLSQVVSGPQVFDGFAQNSKGVTNDVFKDLGLSSFGNVESHSSIADASPKHSDFFTACKPPVTNNVESKPLSLSIEEKEKLAWEQEQHQTFKSQKKVPLVPTNNQTTKPMKMSASQEFNSLLTKNSSNAFGISNPPSTSFPAKISSPQMMTTYNMSMSPSQPPMNCMPFGNLSMQTTPHTQMIPRQNFQPVTSQKSLDLSSLDTLLPSIGRSARTPLNQLSSSSATTPPFQSLHSPSQRPWPPAHMTGTVPLAPVQSGPQSLPMFTEQAKSPKNELHDLLG